MFVTRLGTPGRYGSAEHTTPRIRPSLPNSVPILVDFYCPQSNFGKDNVSKPVCDSVQRRVSLTETQWTKTPVNREVSDTDPP